MKDGNEHLVLGKHRRKCVDNGVLKRDAEIRGRLAFGEILGPPKKLDLLGAGKRLKALMLRYDRLVDRLLTKREKERDGGIRERKDMMDFLLHTLKDENVEVKLTRDNVKAFLLAIIKGTIRLHPTLPIIICKCREDCKISGYDIPVDSRILVNVYAIMRDEDSWEKPTKFLLERFFQSQVDMKGHDFRFFPFGSGRRRCPGLGLSHIVMHVIVATLVQCFDWNGGQRVEMEEG